MNEENSEQLNNVIGENTLTPSYGDQPNMEVNNNVLETNITTEPETVNVVNEPVALDQVTPNVSSEPVSTVVNEPVLEENVVNEVAEPTPMVVNEPPVEEIVSEPVPVNNEPVSTEQPVEPNSVGETPQGDNKPKKKINPIIIILIVVVLLAGIGFGVYMILNNKPQNPGNDNNNNKNKQEEFILKDKFDNELMDKLINDKVVFYNVKKDCVTLMNFIKFKDKNALEIRIKENRINATQYSFAYAFARFYIDIVDGVVKTFQDSEEFKRPEFTIESKNKQLHFDAVKPELPSAPANADADYYAQHKIVEDLTYYIGDYTPLKNEDMELDLTAFYNDKYVGEYVSSKKNSSVKIFSLENNQYVVDATLTYNNEEVTFGSKVTMENNTGTTSDGIHFKIYGDKFIVDKVDEYYYQLESDKKRETAIKDTYYKLLKLSAKDFKKNIDVKMDIPNDYVGYLSRSSAGSFARYTN